MVTVMVSFTIVFGPVPVTGVEMHVASAGKPVQVKLIAVEKLLEVTMPTVLVPAIPGLTTLTFVGPETPAQREENLGKQIRREEAKREPSLLVRSLD